jgi:nucleoside-diphosphate-sugar epimerase
MEVKLMNILVMGGTEFVSSSVVNYLLSKGHEIDIFTRGKRQLNYSGIRTHHKGDRRSIEDLKNTIQDIKYDYVFDISAYNVQDVENLFSVLNVDNLKRYIFCSSGSVYKQTKEIANEEFETGFNENWGDYGFDKLKAENYLMDIYIKRNIPIVIFRPTYIYGENNNLYRECYIFDRLISGQDIPIPDGENMVQFIYIDDLVRVFESAMYEEKAIGQIYNITHPEIITWNKLVNAAMEVTKKAVNIKAVNSNKVKSSREYFPFRDCTYLLHTNKCINDNLYMPNIDILEGLARSYKGIRINNLN